MAGISVVIPVKDAGPLLERVLTAVQSQGEVELIVIDSGSRDRSRDVARAAGAQLIELAPEDFGHGRTRNLGAERSSGELICFLTQDAVPVAGWLDAYREAFALDARVGAAYGPHLPHPDTSPMIARELEEFFATFAPDGLPAVQRGGDPEFLSNVNACYRRECWEEIRFPDLDYAEDQAFGRAMLEAGWAKVYHPGAAVLHAHDYGPLVFLKRYFDEFRGLREASGHVEHLGPLEVARGVVRDQRWMRARGWRPRSRARWAARSALHHAGRRTGAALGSRSQRLPAALQRRLSLEGRKDRARDPVPRGRIDEPSLAEPPFEEILRLSREGPAPLEPPPRGTSERRRLRLAVIVPPFLVGSGGHGTVFKLVKRLEDMGHTCSIWVHDPLGQHAWEAPSVLRRRIVDHFAPVRAPVFKDFEGWYGADVVLATGWETVYPAVLLSGCRARVYLVNDHEPEFFASSAERRWAEETYRMGLYGISASRWLRDLLERRYGQRGSWFRLGVDRDTYHPRPVARRRDTVVFYARGFTGRRALPLGVLALTELRRRRPDTRFVFFGQMEPVPTPFAYEALGVTTPEVLAWNYSEATAGLCLSLTNYSLIPQEMMACGLPCVDLAGGSSEAEFGKDGPLVLADADPLAIADGLERLLGDEGEWRRRSETGLAFVDTASWDLAARQVEAGIRAALREREAAAG